LDLDGDEDLEQKSFSEGERKPEAPAAAELPNDGKLVDCIKQLLDKRAGDTTGLTIGGFRAEMEEHLALEVGALVPHMEHVKPLITNGIDSYEAQAAGEEEDCPADQEGYEGRRKKEKKKKEGKRRKTADDGRPMDEGL